MSVTERPTAADRQSPAVARIREASRRPANLGAAVPGAVSLAMGEPNGDTAPAVVARAVESLEVGRTHYAPASGDPELLAALARHSSVLAGREITAGEVVLGHGGTGVLAATVLALVTPGDRVILPEPTYSLYADHLAMVGATTVWVPNNADGTLDFDAIAAELPSAAMLILCNPSNPTGAVLDADQLRRLAAEIAAHPDVVLVSDEAYSDIVFDGEFTSALALPGIAAQTIRVGTFSKTYAMTGWRLGYAIAPESMAKRIDLVHRTLNGSLATFVQDAAQSALQTPENELQALRETYRRRRDMVVSALADVDRVTVHSPQGAFYAFPKIESSLSSEELVAAFAEGGVLVRAGSEYGPSGEGYVRISFAASESDLAEGLERFATVVAGLPE